MKYMILLMAVLAGCATEGKYKAKLHTWVGHSSIELVQGWGVPQNMINLPDGSKAYEYEYNGSSGAVETTTYNRKKRTLDTTSTNYSNYCKTTFMLGPDDKVKTWRFEGNSCTSSD